jgi:3'-5' exoribonuclease
MILSHHGKLELGSPTLPPFPEALLLHYLDDMDSKMECMRALIASDRQVEGCFTAYNSTLERAILKKDRLLNPEQEAPATPVSPAAAAAPATIPAATSAAPAPQNGRKSESAFADKLKQALQPVSSEER